MRSSGLALPTHVLSLSANVQMHVSKNFSPASDMHVFFVKTTHENQKIYKNIRIKFINFWVVKFIDSWDLKFIDFCAVKLCETYKKYQLYNPNIFERCSTKKSRTLPPKIYTLHNQTLYEPYNPKKCELTA